MAFPIYIELRNNPYYLYREVLEAINTNFSGLSTGSTGGITNVQPGLNTYTGGTYLAPTINVSALTIDNITISGVGIYNTLSGVSFTAETIFSGSANLHSLFAKSADESFTTLSATTFSAGTIFSGNTDIGVIINQEAYKHEIHIQPGLNTYTGGTYLAPTVNISAATLDNLVVSGTGTYNSLSGVSFTAGTIVSGSTNIQSLFSKSSNENFTTLSATTFSAGTYYSGSTPLETIIVNLASGSAVQSIGQGSNITTGGTVTNPTISLVSSPSINDLTFSGTASGNILSATTISGGTINLLPSPFTSGSLTPFNFVRPASTNQTTGVEVIGFRINASNTLQHATGALSIQRETVIDAPTYSFVAASTISTAATVVITGPPIAGTNATITSPYALWTQSGATRIDDGPSSITMRSLVGTTGEMAMYFHSAATANSSTNYALRGTTSTVALNATTNLALKLSDVSRLTFGSTSSVFTTTDAIFTGVAILGGSQGLNIKVGGTITTANLGTGGGRIKTITGTITDSSAAGTRAIMTTDSFLACTFASTNAVTVTQPTTVYIDGPPITGTNMTFTNAALSLWVASGTSKFDGDVKLGTAGKGIYIKEGVNATLGRVVLTGGTASVSTTKVTDVSEIFLTNNVPGGTIGTPYIDARVSGVSFSISSTSILDTSTISWWIVEPS